MNCKDFKDLADSYLSNELLVETNHDVLRHLESCRGCREMLAARRELRERLKHSVTSAEESQIGTNAAARIREQLRASARRPTAFASMLHLGLAGAAAIALIVSVFFWNYDRKVVEVEIRPDNRLPANVVEPSDGVEVAPAVLLAAAHDAFDDHKNCALTHNLKERPISLEKAAKTIDAVNLALDKTVLDALREKFGSEALLIKAHYCLINGRYFTHVVVSVKKHTMSVLMTKLTDAERASSGPRKCGRDANLNSACFAVDGYGLFIVSDAAESDNLQVANTLMEAVSRHISRVRISI